MMIVADIVLSPRALSSFTFSGVLLATIGTLFLAYDLLGRENGPLRWFTLVLTCGIVSTLVFVPVSTAVFLLLTPEEFQLSLILPFILIGGFMGFYTVILVELPASTSKPPLVSWKAGLLGLALTPLAWLVGRLSGPQYALPALILGLACAVLMSAWQRLTWEPAQAGATAHGSGQVVAAQEPSASTPTPTGTGQSVAWKPAHARPHVFARTGVVLGLLLGFLIGFAFFFSVNKDVSASLLESMPLALISAVICGTWRFINWVPPHPTPRLFSRRGFWTGLVAGFVPWLLFHLAADYAAYAHQTGLLSGLQVGIMIGTHFFVHAGLFALANAAAGSIAQYTLWRANHLPHRTLGAFGLVLIIVAFALQGVQPGIEILNTIQ